MHTVAWEIFLGYKIDLQLIDFTTAPKNISLKNLKKTSHEHKEGCTNVENFFYRFGLRAEIKWASPGPM